MVRLVILVYKSVLVGISVNMFREIFNSYFDAKMTVLSDKNYFSIWYDSPYSFQDVTDKVD